MKFDASNERVQGGVWCRRCSLGSCSSGDKGWVIRAQVGGLFLVNLDDESKVKTFKF